MITPNKDIIIIQGKYPFFTCAKEQYEIDNFAFDSDALLISGNGANVGYIHHYCGKFNAYQRTYVLENFKEDIKYIQYFLEAFLAERINQEKKVGNTPYIVISTLLDMNILVPSKDEQIKIASIVECVDKIINTEETKLSCICKLHKGLLQGLFI